MNTSVFHWEPLLAHSHWFSIRAFGKELRLCARCSGVVLGFICSKSLLTALFRSSLGVVLQFQTGFVAALILALPAIIDWTTQAVGFRESNNPLRVVTGFLEGAGVLLLSLTDISLFAKLLIVSTIGVGVISVGVLMRRLSS